MKVVLFLFIVFACSYAVETLLPVGADTSTTSPTLTYNSGLLVYTYSFVASGVSYSYIINMNSTELLTARLNIGASAGGYTFTPIQGASPNYYFGGLIKFQRSIKS